MKGFPKVEAKYPEIQKDVDKGYFGNTILFRVSTIFDEEVYMEQYESTSESISYLDNYPDVINAHEMIFQQMVMRIKETIEKKKSDKVQHMVDQILKINPN